MQHRGKLFLNPGQTCTMEPKRLYRSRKNRVLGGVCGGLGDYLDIDPVILRVILVILIFTVGGILIYLIAWILVPLEPEEDSLRVTYSGSE
jgi:phage shock protein C